MPVTGLDAELVPARALVAKRPAEGIVGRDRRTEAASVRYNRRRFERLWRFAHYLPPEHSPWWPTVAALAHTAGERLEIGCGPWPRLPVAGTHFVDLSGRALEMLARRGARVHPGELGDVAFPRARFDLVGMFELLEHIEDDEALLAEVARISRPGAFLMVSVPLQPSRYNAWDRFSGHVRRYQPQELREKLAGAGFILDRFEVRRIRAGRLAAAITVLLCKLMPRTVMWITERLVLPNAAKQWRLAWRPAQEWDHATRQATDCTLICRRAA
jgi:SAM-dependent methyltransferase